MKSLWPFLSILALLCASSCKDSVTDQDGVPAEDATSGNDVPLDAPNLDLGGDVATDQTGPVDWLSQDALPDTDPGSYWDLVDGDIRDIQVGVDCGEGTEVAFNTTLHLAASVPEGQDLNNLKYHWSVVQPEGSQSIFVASPDDANPTFEVNVVGDYLFTLQVMANEGAALGVAHYKVTATPMEKIHVEVVWDTPGDADQTDEGDGAGADLDLHLAHPSAEMADQDGDGEPDPWFDEPYDCYWYSANPNWGSWATEVDDDPYLAIEDAYGAGPEVITLNGPEVTADYRVGVHYWNANGFGNSLALVRIYYEGQLAFQSDWVELEELDLWSVATIDGETGVVTENLDDLDQPLIAPDYLSPFQE